MAQGLPACCPYRDCWRSATLEALRDQWTCHCTVNIHSWACCLFVNTHVFIRYTVCAQPHMQTETNGHSLSLLSHLPTFISRGVNGGIQLWIGDFNSILTHWICLRSTRVKYAIGCFPLVTRAATGVTSNGLFLYWLQQLFVDFVNCMKYNKHILNALNFWLWWRRHFLTNQCIMQAYLTEHGLQDSCKDR